ncbi:OstA-like protein [Zunongwangia sp. HRR-M8]|uniref:OstA-like protein n=1 Tax=Zunongwangia sp. HRR-M8 TaxID=3015170 RepID=UPI0022DD38F3|nr:OstA-like protein [Zunongwangia sp. HRR-M8]WBL23485.1 OstA-like protein [Zunongwangia sp. HRR-M8]
MLKNFLLTIFFLFSLIPFYAQETGRKIDYENDRQYRDEEKYPGALVMSKVTNQVHFTHQGIEVWCNNAVFYESDNFFKAYGEVRMKQGDTVNMNSDYAEYNGNTQFAFASGQVKMKRPQTTLETDTLFFDRLKQEAYYRSGGKVTDTASVLTSTIGRYYFEEDKYTFLSDVKITNPDYIVNSDHIDFYSDSGHAYLYGPSTIEGEESTVYCERGFYDTRGDTGYFVKNSKIDYDNRTVLGDSLYFDRNTSFASATNNIEVIDTTNNSKVTGHYAEVYREKDSVIITKWPVAASLQDQDSVFIHSDTLLVTGKPEDRIIRGFYDVRLYKTDMSGKSDSIYVNQKQGLTRLININPGENSATSVKRNPVLWSGLSQMTGDTIEILSNKETEQLDSLKVFKNAFLINKDSIEGYNQIKGQELIGLFENNELYRVDIDKNTETLYYSRSENKDLIGINKTLSSRIEVFFKEQQIQDVYYYKTVEGTLKPEEKVPQNTRELQGFNWRGDERLLKKQDLFKGKELPELVRIQGIPLPSQAEDFFDEREDGDMLLNENSRLKPEDLKDRAQDSVPSLKTLIPQGVQIKTEESKDKKADSLKTKKLPTKIE